MKRLKTKNNQLDLSQFEIDDRFLVYYLGNYDFNENLDFDNKTGVYIFTTRDVDLTFSYSYARHVHLHTPLYCGMTKDFNQRFNDHFKAEDLINANCDCISICFCETQEYSIELEEKILSLIKIPFNKDKNDNPKYENVKLMEV